MKTLMVTRSSGLIGSEVCGYFAHELGYTEHGVEIVEAWSRRT
jgi:CDP-paratose 2-epimerase